MPERERSLPVRCKARAPLGNSVQCRKPEGHDGPHADTLDWLKWDDETPRCPNGCSFRFGVCERCGHAR